MTRLIRSRRVLVSSVAAVSLGGALAVVGATTVGSGNATAPRSQRAEAAAQVRAGGQDRTLGGGGHSLRAPAAVSDWPMLRGNAIHSGVSAETTISTATASTLTAGWTATLGTTSYVSPAVATSSTLGKAVVYAGAQSHLYAYPATGGSPIWTFKTGKGGGAFDASPAVFGGVVYAPSSVGTIWALNAATGAVECSYSTGGQLIQASPVVVSDPDGSGPVLYVGTDPPSGAGAEYAIYGAGNSHGACTLDWQFTKWAEANSGSWSPPAYGTDAHGNPILVFGSVGPDDSVYALNANTGALDWRHNTSSVTSFDVGSAPTISAPGNNGFANGVVYAIGKDKVAYALNLTTGAQIWAFKLVKTSNGAVSSSALDGNTLYFGSNDGVYAVNATTGAQVWHVLTGPTFYASAAITGPAGQQVLVIGDNAGRLYALNLTNGATVWTARPNTVGFWASPAISQGTIYTVGLDGVLRTYSPS
jgi:eukaryotic-like serine/threonine-protein kinase